MTKSLTREQRQPTSHIIDNNNGQTITDPQLKVGHFAEAFFEQFGENIGRDLASELRVQRVEIYKNMDHPAQDIPGIDDFKNQIKILENKKAPGLDNIKNNVLKNFPDKTLQNITNITKTIIKIGYFPPVWKMAKVIVIPKKGKDKKGAASYRPISLLSNLGKLVESPCMHSNLWHPV